ncbi:MAG TPA: hypothetical protein PKL69_06640 [Agitococcus sp.]|nr:hypothetical protein [Agitococcus sp.]HNL80010.1 hypothetical protein [Agitococcus sp.]
MLKKVLLLSSLTLLAACNETDSNDISTDKLVLNGSLFVENDAAKMIVDFTKEKSHVTVVLNGGDFVQATDSKSTNVMEYQDDTIWGSSYRATLPLDINNSYKVIFNRAAQNQKFESTFPAIPAAFSIVAPIDKQTFSVTSNPTIDVKWDNKIPSDKLFLRGRYSCGWTANPAVLDAKSQKMLSELTNGQAIDITLNDKERDLKTRILHVQEAVQSMTEGLKNSYPDSTLTFNGCDVDLELIAKSFSTASAEFSGKSELQSYRKVTMETTLTP